MNRRQFLLSVVNLDKYKDLLFNSVYFNTIYDAEIKDKGKIKLSEIEGNGEIVNQLNEYGDMSSTNGYYGISTGITDTTTTLSGDEITFTMNVNGSGLKITSRENIQIIANHKYLIISLVKSSVALSGIGQRVGNATLSSLNNLSANTWTLYSSILSSSVNDLNQSTWYFRTTSNVSVGDTIKMRNAMCIDLTLMFGTGNEPTTTSDNRIQNLINNGYIPYNTGSYKSSIVKEIEMQPYNLFDAEWTQGNITQSNGNYDILGNNIRTADMIKVAGGKTYTIEWERTACNTACNGQTYIYIYEYDENKNYIYFDDSAHSGIYFSSHQITLQPQTRYVMFKIYSSGSPAYSSLTSEIIKMCLHRTDTRTGYAPYVDPIKLNHFTPNKAGSVSDTYKDFVFTRKVGFYTFTGSESWTATSNDRYYSNVISSLIKAPSSNAIVANISFTPNLSIPVSSADDVYDGNAVGIQTNGNIIIRNPSVITSTSAAASFLAGKTIYYELATPTTITMANNCLQCVDLGSLSWLSITSNGNQYFYASNPTQKVNTSNMFCSKYIETSSYFSAMTDKQVTGYGGNGLSIWIRDDSCADVTAFTNTVQGVYLFYETASPLNEFDAGVLTDEMKVTLPKALSLGGAISAQNTFEITKTAYVFTRNVGMVDLGTIGLTLSGGYWRAQISGIKIPATTSTVANILCANYIADSYSHLQSDGYMAVSDTGYIYVKDSSKTQASDFSGIMLYYERSLSQVTTISRKRLKAVDLGTLTYTYEDGVFKVQISDMITGNAGVNKTYIDEYLFELITTLSNMGDRHYARNSNWLYIKDTRYNNATNFKNAVSGITLWYETNADVSDLTDKALFEKGGTITTNEFSWVKNQLIPNDTLTDRGITSSITNGKWSASGIAESTFFKFGYAGSLTEIVGHHYFFYANITKNTNNNSVKVGFFNDSLSGNAVTIGLTYGFRIAGASATGIGLMGYSNGATLDLEYIAGITDLTLAFGAGNEPTSTDDYRIQKILQMGYIPTNTNGTQESVQTEVLCNLDMKVQK